MEQGPKKSCSYPVKLIPVGLSSQETVLEIASSLEYLNAVANDIFLRISQRISSEKESLDRITSEIKGIESRVEEIKIKKTASKLISNSQYPGLDYIPYESPFSFIDPPTYRSHYCDESSSPSDKLHEIFIYKSSSSKKKKSESIQQHRHRSKMKSVSNVLLFNTAERLYMLDKQKDAVDPLNASKKRGSSLMFGNVLEGEAVDQSMEVDAEGDHLLYPAEEEEEVPELDLPDDLGLDNIAEGFTNLILESPKTTQRPQEKPQIESKPSLSEPILTSPINIPSPPPPQPPTITMSDPKNITYPPIPAPPPPPPPPPPSFTSDPIVPSTQSLSSEPSKKPLEAAPVDSRNDLLAAIRNAGGANGARLKSVKDRKLNEPKPDGVKNKVTNGPDLMMLLANNLRLRRKGMSGKIDHLDSGGEKGKGMGLSSFLDDGDDNDETISSAESGSATDSDW